MKYVLNFKHRIEQDEREWNIAYLFQFMKKQSKAVLRSRKTGKLIVDLEKRNAVETIWRKVH